MAATTTATPAATSSFGSTRMQPPPAAKPAPSAPSTAGSVKSEAPPTPTSTAAAAVRAGAEDPSYIITVPSYSAWFSYDSIHDTERRLLPDFFEEAEASGCRGPDAYKYYRDTLVRRFRSRPGQRLTLTEARRGLVGDVGSIRRVFDFLEEWGLINYGASPPSGSKQGKEKREEAGPRSSLHAGGATAPKKLCTRCRTVCGLAYFICEKADTSLCARCFLGNNYRPGLAAADFKRVEMAEDAKSDWTDKETLHLLEAVLHYGEDWKKVSEHVGSRSEKDCTARFIRLPFGEQLLGPKEDKLWSVNDDGAADESGADVLKRLCLTPLADATNPIMAQVAFLSAIAGSDAVSAAAQAAISAQSQIDLNDEEIDSSMNSTRDEVNDLHNEAAANARAQLEKERNSIEQSLSDIVDVQMKEIQNKIYHFEQEEAMMERERQQLHYLRKSLFSDQLVVAQHQCRPPAASTERR